MISAAARVVTAGLAIALCLVAPAPAKNDDGVTTVSLDAYDVIELEIAYTTVLARYYEKVPPRTLVDGARTGIAADLIASGVEDANLPFTRANVTSGDGEDLVDAMVVRTLVRYGTRIAPHRLVQAAVAGELAALRDPYSLLFRPRAFAKFNAFLGNETFGGIGAIVSFDDRHLVKIDRVLPASPAERAGLLRGDELTAIDGRPLSTIGGAEALRDALRGKIGTTVAVSYRRAGTVEPATITIVRAAIRDPEVTTHRFDDIGYLALSRFGDRSGDEVTGALRDFASDGLRGVILDLRGNGGGYGNEATAVASAFLRSGAVFTTRERGGAVTVSNASGKPVWTGALAILVDGDTASAAEIVAGAIQDDHIGTLVGARTFGKGVVQSIFPLPDGSAVKLTTARYTTPAGRDIDRHGITPDVLVPEPAGSTLGDPGADPALARALAVVHGAPISGS